MNQQELEIAVTQRIDIPEDTIKSFWQHIDGTNDSAIKNYEFWCWAADKWPALREGTWRINPAVFHPAFEKIAQKV